MIDVNKVREAKEKLASELSGQYNASGDVKQIAAGVAEVFRLARLQRKLEMETDGDR
jgi:hypothetical protein